MARFTGLSCMIIFCRRLLVCLCIFLLLALLFQSFTEVSTDTRNGNWYILGSVAELLQGYGIYSQFPEAKIFNCSYPPKFQGKKILMQHLYAANYSCPNLVRLGEGHVARNVVSTGKVPKPYRDGAKYMCMESKVNLNMSDCLVYSFGIANVWDFEDEIGKLGCEVHSFDPTIKLQDHRRSPKVMFHNLGLSDHNGTISIGKFMCKVLRLEEIIEMLNHTERKIDYLKIDIEGSEIEVFNDIVKTSYEILTNQVVQLGMEIHLTPFSRPIGKNKIMEQHWELLQKLSCLGFELVHNDPNVTGEKVTYQNETFLCCYELLWINTNLIYEDQ